MFSQFLLYFVNQDVNEKIMNDTTRPSADKTRSSILNAARKLFVKQGFAGTSISQIAKKAGINQSLIYHHFGDKEKLWKQTKSDILTLFADVYAHLLDSDLSGEVFIREFIELRIKIVAQASDVQRMLLWQRLEPASQVLRGSLQISTESWINAIKKLQARGEFKQDLSPRMILSLLYSMASGFADVASALDLTELEIAEYQKRAITLLSQALLPH